MLSSWCLSKTTSMHSQPVVEQVTVNHSSFYGFGKYDITCTMSAFNTAFAYSAKPKFSASEQHREVTTSVENKRECCLYMCWTRLRSACDPHGAHDVTRALSLWRRRRLTQESGMLTSTSSNCSSFALLSFVPKSLAITNSRLYKILCPKRYTGTTIEFLEMILKDSNKKKEARSRK